eukprot:TRINITY_DN16076_c0_g1_i1.p1 TRINITY_DN16076_c0_g1~~TRINITY_DN16076_c0_g1_i1.p1  ORF type:complete len:536 (+),score=82.96 TRINITY_DN16076_c0_g1_i1:65-1672(+)
MSNQGDGYRHGNYGRDTYNRGGGDYRSNDSYNRNRQVSGSHSGAYGQHGGGHYGQGHPPQHQSRDPRHGGQRGGPGGGSFGPRVGGSSGRDNLSSAPQTRDPRHSGRSYHSSHGGSVPPPTQQHNNNYNNSNRDRERDRQQSSSSPRQAHSPQLQQAASPSSGSQTTAAKSAPTKEEDASEMTVEVGLGITPTAHCSVLVEQGEDMLLFLGDNDGSIAVIDVRGDRTVNYFKTKTAVSDLTTTSDQKYLIAAVGQSVLIYNVVDLKQRLSSSAEADGSQNSPTTSKKDRLLTKRRIDISESVKPDSEVQLNKESGAIVVSLKVVDKTLFVGDSEGSVHKYSLSSKSKLTFEGSSRFHNSNVTGISASDTQLITSSSAGTVVFSSLTDPSTQSQILPCVMESEKKTGAMKRSSSGLQKAAAYTSTVVCAVTCIDVDSDGLWLVVGGDVPYVPIVSLLTGKVVRVIILPNSDWKVKSVRFVRAEIIIGVDDSYVLSYSLTGELQSYRFTPCDTVHTIAVSTSGCWAVSGKNTNAEVF